MGSKHVPTITAITVALLGVVSLWCAILVKRDLTKITGDHGDHDFLGAVRIPNPLCVITVIGVIHRDLTKITVSTREKMGTVIGVIGTWGLA